MSSLRRRAIVVQRARSTERSSTGGRVRARTTAAESLGSARARSQAIASRTSGRRKKAAEPALRKGTLRSSSAAVTSRPSRPAGPVITQSWAAVAAPEASRCSISRATACAWARSLAQRHSRTSRPPALSPRRVGLAAGRRGPGVRAAGPVLAGNEGGDRGGDAPGPAELRRRAART